MKTRRPSLLSENIRHIETMIEYGKYLILEGIYPHIGFHISLLEDGNIHNIKLIYRSVSNNDHPEKIWLTFCRVYLGNSHDIKGNRPYDFLHLHVIVLILTFDHRS